MRAVACARVDGWSGHLFGAEGRTGNGTVRAEQPPWLCKDFCGYVYDKCGSVTMSRTLLVGGNGTLPTTIKTAFPTKDGFCGRFTDPTNNYCFNGAPYKVPPPKPFVANFSLCYEKVIKNAGPFASVDSVPGKGNLTAFASLNGKVDLYQVSSSSGKAFVLKSRLLDLSAEILFGGEMGLLGFAFHKKFSSNGRFYVSYSCRGSAASLDCSSGDSIVDEFTINPNTMAGAPISRRRIFKTYQPYSNHNGGQVLFSPDPNDSNLYFMLGDGGSAGDPENRAQNMNDFHGKILRLDVDSTHPNPGYAIPFDNPFVDMQNVNKEIFALGLRNPWRCHFDAVTFIFYCGDVGQNAVEEVDIITKGGNYGWSRFEGAQTFNTQIALAVQPDIKPIISYTHQEIWSASDAQGCCSITGGPLIRSTRDSRLVGNMLFGDLYGALFLAQESPDGSGQFRRSRIGKKCSRSSPFVCSVSEDLNYIINFSELRAGNDVLASDYDNVYRFVDGANCS